MDFDAKFEQNNQLFDAKFDDNGSSFDSNFGETNVVHSGKNGATFIPSVSEEGIISWTNDRNLENPSPVDIKGKSAYKYAQEGGYTGTEAEFAEKLADQSTLEYVTAGQKEGTKLGIASTAEGAQTTASGNQAHAEGHSTVASGDQAHAEGYETKATASAAHAEGIGTLADAQGAHAQGKFTKATGDASAANGYWTEANNTHQFVVGRVNENDPLNLFEVGGGAVCYDKDTDTFHEEQFDRFNVFEVSHDGQARAETLATKDTIFNRKDGATKDGVEYARWHNGTTGKVDPIVIPGAVASGFQSVAFGGQRIDKTLKAYTKNPEIPATEPQTQALGDQSFAAGGSVIVNGDWSAGFGKETITYQKAAFATGGGTRAGCTEEEYTKYAAVQRDDTSTYAASYSLSVAEGELTKALGRTSHAEGRYGLTTGMASHVEGNESVAIGKYSHAEGWQTKTGTFTGNNKTGEIVIETSGNAAHAEGRGTTANADYAHAEGTNTVASSTASHAEGNGSVASGQYSHAEGASKASNECAHAEGKGTTASGKASHTEGEGTIATHANAHAEGYSTDAINENAHAEGKNSIASGASSHAEGDSTKAAGAQAHTEGASTIAIGNNSHTEGYRTLAKGIAAHAEGYSVTDLTNKYDASSSDSTIKTEWEASKNFGAAVGQGSHVEGLNNLAYGRYSHVGGSSSEAVGNNSFAHGDHVTASVANQAVFGKYNEEDADALFIIGNGTDTNNKNNAFAVKKDGTIVSDYLDSITKGFATEDYVEAKVAGIVDSSPETLNTLNELAKALGDDPNFATTVANRIGRKLDESVFNDVISYMYGDDITGDTPTIREIANDEVSKLPLVGTTAELTPLQVAEAVAAGRPISLTHADPTFGILVGNNSYLADNGQTVLTSCVVQFGEHFVAYELFGSIDAGEWNSTYSVLADGEQVYDALAGKVPISRTVNGKALTSNITLTKSDIGLDNVDNTADSSKIVAKANQLTNERNIGISGGVNGTAVAFDGTKNISIPVDSIKESYLTWGGRNIVESISPLAAAMSSEHSANRLAFINPNAITVEYSNDGGVTWQDSNLSDQAKVLHVTSTQDINIGTTTSATTGNRMRMTLTARSGETSYVYMRPRKLLIDVNDVSHTINVTVEYKTGKEGASWATLGSYRVSGWSGWNEIDLNAITTFGGGITQTSNYWYIRLTYENTAINSSTAQAPSRIRGIRLFGETSWNSTSNMGANGHLYSYDWQQNAMFPAKVDAPELIENGTSLSDKYALKTSVPDVSSFISKEEANSKVNISYDKIISRGEQLIVNGSGLMGDNTNFSSWEFDPAEANNSVGSFTRTSTAYAQVFTDEPFPINPNLTYTLSIDAKSKNSTATIYSMLNFLDSDGLTIQAKDHMHSTSSTTTLAKDLKSGDSVIYFADLSGWNVNLSYGYYLTLWNYKNSFGYTYPVGTYSRNRIVLPNINSLIDTNAIDFVNNTITLNKPYSGATIPANTPVSQGCDGASYKYIAIKWANAPTSWKTYTDNIGGVDYSGQNLSNKFPPGTAYATFGMLWNSNSAQDQVWITNVSLTANSVTGAATTIIKNDLSAGYALISNSSGKVGVGGATSTELGYLRGVTSNIQSQLNNKPTLAQVGTLIDEKLGVIENASY